MLIALANPEGDFTATLFLPHKGEADSFEALTDRRQRCTGFFDPGVPRLRRASCPDLGDRLLRRPHRRPGHRPATTSWGTSTTEVVLVGDAAYGIVPFHGQGMNLGMESARVLDRYLREYPRRRGSGVRPVRGRPPPRCRGHRRHGDRQLRRDAGRGWSTPSYLIRRELALELERRYPAKVGGPLRHGDVHHHAATPRSSSGPSRQNDILAELTDGVSSLDEVDFDRAEGRAGRAGLAPLPAWT